MKITKLYITLLFVVLVGTFSSCTTDTPADKPYGSVGNDIQIINGQLYTVLNGSNEMYVYNITSEPKPAVYILNEGAFQHTNASLDRWVFSNAESERDVYKHLTVVKHITFPNGTTPNEVRPISSTQALVTEGGTGRIDILDLNTYSIVDSVVVNSFGTSAIEVLGNYSYFIGYDGDLHKMKNDTKALDKVFIGDTPYDFYIDEPHNAAVVLCWGGDSPKTNGKIVWVDLTTLEKKDSLVIPALDYTARITGGGGKCFLLYSGKVAMLDLASHSIANDNFIPTSFYGGNYDSDGNELYLGQFTNFQNPGEAYVYDGTTGTLKKTLKCGIGPAHFVVAK